MVLKTSSFSLSFIVVVFVHGLKATETDKRSHGHGDPSWIADCWDHADNKLTNPFCPQTTENCTKAPEIVHGYHKTPYETTVGSTVLYACNDGYFMTGKEVITCTLVDVNGEKKAQWTNPPNCTKVQCGPPPIPANAVHIPEPLFTTVTEFPFTTTTEPSNETLANMTLTGDNETTTVAPSGNMTETNETNAMGAGATTVLPAGNSTDMDNNTAADTGTVGRLNTGVTAADEVLAGDLTVLQYYVNDTVWYQCNPGYAFEVHHWTSSYEVEVMTCRQDVNNEGHVIGTYWDNIIKCVPECDSVPLLTCANFTPPENTLMGTNVTYNVFKGQKLIGSPNIVCLPTGNWSEIPYCLPGCDPAPEIEYGSHSSIYETTLNATVNYVCDDGYFVIGAEVVTCEATNEPPYAKWTAPPSCTKTCSSVPSVDNAYHTEPKEVATGSVVTYTCWTNGTMIGSENVTCTENGTWTKLPVCLPVCVGPPPIPNSIRDVYTYNETTFVKISCEYRYTLVGNSTLECREGTWSLPFPYCKCDPKPVDMVFIIDGSGSLGTRGFNQTLQFVANMIGRFPPQTTRFGLLVFSSDVYPQFYLNQFINDTQGLLERVANTSFPMGGTETWKALQFARTDMFQVQNGMRPNVTHTAIVVTDGRSDNFNQTVTEAQLLRDAGVTIYSIGVGLLDQRELLLIASNSTFVFHVSDYNSIDEIEGPLAGVTCASTLGMADEGGDLLG